MTIAAAVVTVAGFGQTMQRGVIKEYNEKRQKTPLAGVEVAVRSAGSTVSDKNGNFMLTFNAGKPGERVTVRRIEKNGYEIFNKEALEQWNLNPSAPFVIVMCRSDRFKKIRDNYERVSSANYARQLKREEEKLARLKAEGKLKEAEYQQELARAREEYEKQLDNLDAYVDRFSRIDLSELSATEQAIIDLVNQGKLDEAVAAYEQQDYVGKYRQQVAESKTIKSAQEQLAEAARQKQEAREALRGSIDRQIETLRLTGGRENFNRIGVILREVADADTTDVQAAFAFAEFISNQGYYDLSDEYLDRMTKYGDDNQKLLAQFQREANQMCSGNGTSLSFEKLKQFLDSDKNPDSPWRLAMLMQMVTVAALEHIPVEQAKVYFDELERYPARTAVDIKSKLAGRMAMCMYKHEMNYYASDDEEISEYQQLFEDCLDFREKYGDTTPENVFAPLANMYLAALFKKADWPRFEEVVNIAKPIALEYYVNNPERYYDTFDLVSKMQLLQLATVGDEQKLLQEYQTYVGTLQKNERELTPQRMLNLLNECAAYIGSLRSKGLASGNRILTMLFDAFPPENYGNPVVQEMTCALIDAFDLPGDFSRYEKLADIYLESNPALVLPHLLKAEGMLRRGERSKAQIEYMKADAANKGQSFDLINTVTYRKLYGSN